MTISIADYTPPPPQEKAKRNKQSAAGAAAALCAHSRRIIARLFLFMPFKYDLFKKARRIKRMLCPKKRL
ncbi:MAG: hypothetical protein LBP19_07040 [Treponema sp.]|nr:hypothetical protein [Treponema sp.]